MVINQFDIINFCAGELNYVGHYIGKLTFRLKLKENSSITVNSNLKVKLLFQVVDLVTV